MNREDALRYNEDLIGRQFGSWTVLDPKEKGIQLEPGCLYCRCVCGTEREVLKANLLNGRSRSCGCMKSSFQHLKNLTPDSEIGQDTWSALLTT